jgi:5-methylcytosine-specific restriction endonuclease McrA
MEILDGWTDQIKSNTTRPRCLCGNLVASKGAGKYRKTCYKCHMTGKRFKLDHCERCGFIPEDLVQLDIDHINGDRTNNDSSNLQTLCANCHRLKTKAFDDWNKRREEVQ